MAAPSTPARDLPGLTSGQLSSFLASASPAGFFEVIVRQEGEFLLEPGQHPMGSGLGRLNLILAGDPLDGPLQAVRVGGSKPGQESAGKHGHRHQSDDDRLEGAARPRRPGGGRHLQDFRPGLPDEGHHRRGDEAFHDADGQVDRQHHEINVKKGSAEMPEKSVSSTTAKAPITTLKWPQPGSLQNAAPGRSISRDLFINQGVRNETGKNPMLKMLHPRANNPPSAKNRACTVTTEARVRKAA